MNRYLVIILASNLKIKNSFKERVKIYAEKLKVEGSLFLLDENRAEIKVKGEGEKIDNFIDYLYGLDEVDASFIEIKPILKSSDFRGAFRVL